MTAIERITPGVRLILTLVLVGWVWRAFSPVLGAGEWLADFPQAVLHGQLWRLVTYPFAVGLNSSTLIGTICFAPFAIIVERDLGSVRFQRLFWGSTLLSSIQLEADRLPHAGTSRQSKICDPAHVAGRSHHPAGAMVATL